MVLHKKTGLRELALFAGAGGGILGGLLHGWRTVAAVEIEDYPRRVLLQRQADGILPRFPIWDDVCTFDGYPWRGRVDIVTGGFPCQDISAAGKGKGIEGERSGLWKEMARIIGEVRPTYAFVENSPLLISRGLTAVLSDFAEMGYDARWCIIGGREAGGPVKGERLWLYASTSVIDGSHEVDSMGKTPNIEIDLWLPRKFSSILSDQKLWDSAKRGREQLCDGMATVMDETRAIGNGQIPAVAALAWDILSR